MSDWITTKEASEILGVNIRTIQRYIEKGKLKTKTVSGRNVVKKEMIEKLSPTPKTERTKPTDQLSEKPVSAGKDWSIPEGYLLIDRSTLESLREQIKNLTDSVGEMQLTQKLLIEKGLNLKEEQLLSSPHAQESDSQNVPEVISTPIETVAKAHEDFFGKKKKGNLNIVWIIALALLALIALLVIVNILANSTI